MSTSESARSTSESARSTSESARGFSRRQLFSTTGKAGLLVASFGGIAGFLDACSSAGTTSPSASTGTGAQGTATSAAAGTPTKGGTLNAAITGNPSGLDPAVDDIYTGTEVYDNIFSKLSRDAARTARSDRRWPPSGPRRRPRPGCST